MIRTRNDILAEYVRKKYPGIETSIEFIVYKFAVRFSDAIKTLSPGDLQEAYEEEDEDAEDDVCDNEGEFK